MTPENPEIGLRLKSKPCTSELLGSRYRVDGSRVLWDLSLGFRAYMGSRFRVQEPTPKLHPQP